MKINFEIYILFLFITASCHKLLVKPNLTESPSQVFNQVWHDIKDNYVFFAYNNVNWDSIKQAYEPHIDENMSDQALYDVICEMMLGLKDGHTSLYTPFDTCKYYFFNGIANNYNAEFVDETYLVPNNVKTTEGIKHCFITDEVAYWHYPSFGNSLTEDSLNEILNQYTNSIGLIIDVRDNTGGSNSNIYRLLEHFVTQEELCGYFQEKSSHMPNDFTSPYPIHVSPRGVSYQKPVVILTNRKVYSSANIFTGFMSQLPNVTVIGDTTGGGCGLPTSNQLSNGWLFRFSSAFITMANGELCERGIIPDISTFTDSASALMGQDLIIEKAIFELQ